MRTLEMVGIIFGVVIAVALILYFDYYVLLMFHSWYKDKKGDK